jgi:predicted RNA-binding protein YlxR (DUF448 family)
MMARSVLRTCVGCRRVREQEGLVRITAHPAGHMIVHPRRAPRAPGRGAYLCPSLSCLEQAWRRKVFSRALRREHQGLDEAGMRARFEAELRSRGVIGP